MEQEFKCRYCNKICKNANSLRNHERLCKLNPNRSISKFEDIEWQKNKTGDGKGINKFIKAKQLGIIIKVSDETKEKIRKKAKNRKHSKETKEKISKSMHAYLLKNPDKVPYRLNHYSKGISYPERYFKFILDYNKIFYEFQYSEGLYNLDFKIGNIDLEIDGEQHYLDKRVYDHDIIRNENLKKKGYKIIRIRWSIYKKLSKEQRKRFIKALLNTINTSVVQ